MLAGGPGNRRVQYPPASEHMWSPGMQIPGHGPNMGGIPQGGPMQGGYMPGNMLHGMPMMGEHLLYLQECVERFVCTCSHTAAKKLNIMAFICPCA